MSKGISLLVTAMLTLSAFGIMVAHGPVTAGSSGTAVLLGGGNGTVENPYVITDVWELHNMIADLTAHYALGNHIDASDTGNWEDVDGIGFMPIGNPVDQFTGSLDGRGYLISGLYINRPDMDYVGLFGCINNAEVKNIGLSETDGMWIQGNDYVGGLVGRAWGTSMVMKSFSEGIIIGENRVGGLIGSIDNSAVVENCYATGPVYGNSGDIGGLVGLIGGSSQIINCYAAGLVHGPEPDIGGLVGRNIESGYVEGSFYDYETTGQNDTGKGDPKSTAEMQTMSTFIDWDMSGTWWMEGGSGYPILRWQLTQRGPIRINSNAGFTTANGVRYGDGSAGNPWIIDGWEIDGTGHGYGIYIGNTTEHFVVRDCHLYNASGGDYSNYYPNAGLALYNVANGSATGNVLADNQVYGMHMEEGSDVTLANNSFMRNDVGAWIKWADNVACLDNEFIECWAGIYYWTSQWGNITGNYLEDSKIHLLHSANSNVSSNELLNAGITLESNLLNNWNTHTMFDNTVNGKPVIYWKDVVGGQVPAGAGQIILANCTGVTVENQNIANTSVGILMGFSDGNIITNCTLSMNDDGILLYGSDSNLITNCTALHNRGTGIRLESSSHNTVLNCTTESNGNGIMIYRYSDSNTIRNCTLANNQIGIYSIFNNDENLIYHNKFLSNTFYQATDDSLTNLWDNGYPGGGNYWSDYTGPDLFNGPAQDLPGGDGLGDTPYLIDGGAQDNYPLLQPWFPDTESPVADAGPNQTVDEDTLVQFNGTGSSDNVGVVNYTWTFDDAGPKALFGPVPTYTFNTPGNYTLTLTVWDSAGNSDADTMLVNVRDTTPPQSDPIVPASADEGQEVMFDGSFSFDNVGIVNYTWTFDDGGFVTLYGMFVNYSFNVPGEKEIWLTVRDAAGNTGMGAVSITINDIYDPVANAGPDQIVDEDAPMQFDGTGSWDSAGIVNYTWTFTDGGPRILYSPMPTYTFNTPGNYTVTLTVRDPANRTHADTVQINVRDITPPVANAGSDDVILVGNNFQFNGATSTDNVGVVNHTWNFTYDGSMMYLYGPIPWFTFDIHGVYTVTLTVRDAAGNTGFDTMNLTVRETTPPVANAGPDQSVDEDTIVTFDGSGSSDNVGVVNWTWQCNFQTATQNGFMLYGVSAQYTFETPGTYTVNLKVTDAAGNWAEDSMEVVVRDITAPQVDAGPDANAYQYISYEFNAYNCSDNVGITEYEWSFTHDGNQYTLNGQIASFVFEISGSYLITLTAEDAAGNSASDTMTLTVIDTEDPVANAGGHQTVPAGTLVTLNGTGSMDNVGIANYTWSFPYDGSSVNLYGAVVTFRFDIPGQYMVTFTVTDSTWNVGTSTITITVTEVDGGDGEIDDDTFPVTIGPVLDPAGTPISGALVTLTINGTEYTGSTDADGNAMISVPRDAVDQEAAVSISKDGYDTASYAITISQDGTPATQPPAMDEAEQEPEETGGIGDFTWIILIIVIVAVIGLVAFMMMGKGKAADEPEEAAPEEVTDESAGEEAPPEE